MVCHPRERKFCLCNGDQVLTFSRFTGPKTTLALDDLSETEEREITGAGPVVKGLEDHAV